MANHTKEHATSLEELMEGVPEVLQTGVRAFLKAHQLEIPHELAAAAPEDLTRAFALEPPEFTLGHRVIIRRLREAARRLPPPSARPSSLSLLAQPSSWLGPNMARAVEGWWELWRWAPGLYVSGWTLLLVWILGAVAHHTGLWTHLTEWDARCSHEPLPGSNDTGIKFLILTASQRGARTLSQSLYRMGVEQSFQGVDLATLLWSGLYDDYHRRPEHGGRRYNSDHLWHRLQPVKNLEPDAKMLLDLPPTELASAVSRCRIEALSFTGMENLFWPIYRMSPQAKVIFVHRGWENMAPIEVEYMNPSFVWVRPFINLLESGNHMLPWGALLHLADPLAGGRIRVRLLGGGPPLTQAWDPLTALWYRALHHRRATSHRTAGLHWIPSGSHDYESWVDTITKEIPESRLTFWELDENEWQELCDLANVTSCPLKGTLQKIRKVPDFHFDDVFTFWLLFPLNVLLVWLDALFLKFAGQYAWKKLVMPLDELMEVPGLRTAKAAGLRLHGGLLMLAKPAAIIIFLCYYAWVTWECVRVTEDPMAFALDM